MYLHCNLTNSPKGGQCSMGSWCTQQAWAGGQGQEGSQASQAHVKRFGQLATGWGAEEASSLTSLDMLCHLAVQGVLQQDRGCQLH